MKIFYLFIGVLFVLSCSKPKTESGEHQMSGNQFNPSVLKIQDNSYSKRVKGQVLYLPVYSSVPQHIENKELDLSAFVAVHNTDFINKIRITNVHFFNTDGLVVTNFLKGQEIVLNPLCTKTFKIPYEDKSSIGANFIIEWISDSLVCEPLLESIMINTKGNENISFLSQGRIIREIK